MCDIENLLDYGLMGTFDTICMLYGDSTALIDSILTCEEVSLLELQSFSTALACQLFYRFGVRKGDFVFIVCDSYATAEVVSILACVRLLAPFVPIDIKWLTKNEYFMNIVADVQPKVAIVVAESDTDDVVIALSTFGIHRFAFLGPNGEMSFEHISDVPIELPDTMENDSCNKQTLLYVLYTSGSTGKAKGVMGTHEGLINRVAWQLRDFPWAEDEVMCRRTPLTFVDAMAEIFSALLGTVPLWVPARDVIAEEGIEGIVSSAADAGVTRITILPSQLSSMLRRCPDLGQLWPSLRLIVVSGEATVPSLVTRFRSAAPDVLLVNLYGSTEVAGDVTYSVLSDSSIADSLDDSEGGHIRDCNDASSNVYNVSSSNFESSVPIGRPIEGNNVFIGELHDGDLSELPDGTVGEIFVSGLHLAIGYLNNEEETQRRFILHHKCKSDGMKCFRTGDLGVKRGDGSLVWLGRCDRQVKVRGTRVELEQVEAALRAMLEADTGIAVVCGHFSIASLGTEVDVREQHAHAHLVAFIEHSILTTTKFSSIASIREQFSRQVTAPMFPSLFLLIDALPLTSSGKVDFPALRMHLDALSHDQERVLGQGTLNVRAVNSTAPIIKDQGDVDQTSIDSIQFQLCILFREVLPRIAGITTSQSAADTVSDKLPESSLPTMLQSNFFELGGDSMLAVELRWRISRHFGVQLTVRDLLSTVGELSDVLQQRLSLESTAHAETTQIVDPVQPVLSSMTTTQDVSEDSEDDADQGSITKKRKRDAVLAVSDVWKDEDNEETSLFPEGLSIGWSGRAGNCHEKHLTAAAQSTACDSAATDCLSVLTREWSVRMRRCVDASPLLVWALDPSLDAEMTPLSKDSTMGAVLFIGSHGGDFSALTCATGSVLWTTNLENQHVEGSAAVAAASRLVVVGSYRGLDVDGPLMESGPPKETVLGPQLELSVSINGTDRLGRLWALRLSTGAVVWSVALPGEVKGAPVVQAGGGGGAGDESVWVGAHDHCLRRFHCSTGEQLVELRCAGAIFATPVLTVCGSRIYAACTDVLGTIHAFSTATYDSLWTYESGAPVFSSPVVSPQGDIIFGGVDGKLRCLTSEGSLRWMSSAKKPVFSSPCLYRLSNNACDSLSGLMVLWGSHDGHCRCTRASDGQLLWDCNLGSIIFSSPCHLHDNILVATTDGSLSIIDSTGIVKTRLALSGELYSSLVVLPNSRLVFVGCRDDFVYCLKYS